MVLGPLGARGGAREVHRQSLPTRAPLLVQAEQKYIRQPPHTSPHLGVAKPPNLPLNFYKKSHLRAMFWKRFLGQKLPNTGIAECNFDGKDFEIVKVS